MSQKTLKTKRVFAYAIYNNLRNTAPKEYPSTAEIKDTISSILPALKVVVDGYGELMTKAQDLAVKLHESKDMPKEEADKLVAAMNEEWKSYNKEHGDDVVDIVLEESAMKTLKAQFEREGWGKKWIATIEEFGELLESFAEAVK